MEYIDDVAEEVYKKTNRYIQIQNQEVFGGLMAERDLRHTAKAAVWLVNQREPDLERQELIRKSVNEVMHFSEHFHAFKDRNYRFSDRAARMLLEERQTKTVGDAIPVRPTFYGEQDSDYEEHIAKISSNMILSKCLLEWEHPDLALAYILYTSYGYSVPDILEMYGFRKEDLTKAQWGAIRKRMWQHIKACDQYVKELLEGIDNFSELQQYFGHSMEKPND